MISDQWSVAGHQSLIAKDFIDFKDLKVLKIGHCVCSH